MPPKPNEEDEFVGGGENIDVEDVGLEDPTSPAGADETTTSFGVAGYDVMLDRRAISYIGQVVVAIVLLIACIVSAKGMSNRGYGLAVSIVVMVFGLVGLRLALQPSLHDKSLGINIPMIGELTYGSLTAQFLFIWWFIGASILTFTGPFEVTSNGYFACWGGVICALASLGVTPDALRSQAQGIGIANGLIVAALIQIASVSQYLGSSSDGGAAIYSFVICILTVIGIMAQSHVPQLQPFQFHFYALFGVFWLVLACLVTFRGPFLETGNGYFSSWAGLVLCGWLAAAFRS